MSPGTSFHFFHRGAAAGDDSAGWALVIAVLFAVVAAVSFAVDQSVALSDLATPPAQTSGR